jgi:hypothetical protein
MSLSAAPLASVAGEGGFARSAPYRFQAKLREKE